MEKVITKPAGTAAPLGLLGFGATTLLLNLHNAGLFGLNNMILIMGLFYGGAAQVIAGMQENKRDNTFGAAAFTSYGLFWWSLVGILILNKMGYTVSDKTGMASYMFTWALITLIFFIGTLTGNTIGKVVFGLVLLLFIALGFHFAFDSALMGKVAGYIGITAGLSAIYEAAAILLNEKFNKTMLPV